jgi:hypothetical protein
MSQVILNGIDLGKNEIRNFAVQVLATPPGSPVVGQEYFDSALGHLRVWVGTGWEQASGASGGGTGTVSSVALALPADFTVTGSPVIGAGTLTATRTSQAAGLFLASPNGTAGAPTYRAVVAADVPKALDHTWVTDFDTQVRTSRLDQLAAPTAAVGLNGQRLTGIGTPTAAADAATKGYADAVIQGLSPKPTATVATAGPLPASTYANGAAGAGATLTGAANGALAVDGHAVVAGETALVKDQAAAAQNGLYDVTQAGSAGTPFLLTRDPDMDAAGEVAGAFIPVGDAGTANANSLWLCNPAGAVTVGTTAIPFTQLNKGTDLAAGAGISIVGNTVAIAAAYAGQASITTLGTVTAGTWQGTAVAVGFGGTGAATAAGARANLGAVGKYSALIGDGTATSIGITQATHGLAANGQMTAQLFDATTGALVLTDTAINNTNGTVTFTFAAAPAAGAYRVVLVG